VSDDNDDDDDDAIGSDDDGDNDGDSTASKKKKKAPTGKAGREQVRRVALRKEKQVVIDAYDRIEADVYDDFRHQFEPPFFARFHQRRLSSAASRGLRHADRYFVLTGVLSALCCVQIEASGSRNSSSRS